MSIPEEATGSHHDPLDAVIADYLQQVEAGTVPDREALLAQHPALAEGLRDFFADLDHLDRQAGELHLSGTATAPAGERPHVRYFGEYELLEVIARGGMGVVYKARQQSLNRLVALKMILHGQLATPRAVARFRAEAEAAANLDHPHIVPIYEVGEHEGQQYFTMRFIEGASLARQPRGDLRSEVHLVATVAQAVHYAHQHGILHRDIKPSNILLADSVPFVTDFGLAKRLDSPGDLTGTGETPGTPRYMAPEQAAGRKDLTVAADVYSLGVVLYERLTGTTPFKGDDVLEMMRQVREAEPPRPSILRPGLDRDLETICLKCLEKEPAKRYASAEALADDLERWRRGEPILARPVGSLERFTRWCRRNPMVAGLAGAVAASLLAGTVISTYFAVAANQRANAERAERQRAQAAEDDLEKETAVSLIGPLDPNGNAALSQPEVEALWRLAGATNEKVRLRFLEEALRTETTASLLRHRAAWFVHGAVGLDPQRRARAEQLLVEGMKDPDRSLRHRTEIAWAALGLSERGSPVQRASAEVIGQGYAAEEDWNLRTAWREFLLVEADEFAPAEAARLLNQTLAKEKDAYFRIPLAQGLAKVAGHLEPVEAGRMCARAARLLNQALAKEKRDDARRELAWGLAAVVAWLEPAEAAKTARLLVQALPQEKNSHARKQLATCLAVVAARLEPAEAAEVARLLVQALAREKDYDAREQLATCLAAVAARLEPAKAAEVARLLVQALAQEMDSSARWQLATCLAAVAARLEPAEAARLLNQALAREDSANVRGQLAQGLAAAAARLEPAEAARFLNKALAQEKSDYAHRQLADGVASVAGRLEPAEAARVCAEAAGLLSQAFAQESKDFPRRQLAAGLVAVAGRLEPNEAARLLNQALARVKEEGNANSWESGAPRSIRGELVRGLTVVAGKLEPAEATRVCTEAARFLNQALDQEKNAYGRQHLAGALTAVAGWLEPAEAARLLNQALDEEKDVNAREQLAMGLAAVAGRLEPAEAARLLKQALDQEKVERTRGELIDGLAAVAGRMEPAVAARMRAEAARLYIQALQQEPAGTPRYAAAERLSRFMQPLDSESATRAARALARRIVSQTDFLYSEEGEWSKVSVFHPEALEGILVKGTRPQVQRRAIAIAAVIAISAQGPTPSLPLLSAAGDPLPCRLTTQDLVELLKMPTCIREVRRLILDQLGNRYRRRFDTHWDFVRYAQEQGLDLDFTTPPKRPDRKLPPLFEE